MISQKNSFVNDIQIFFSKKDLKIDFSCKCNKDHPFIYGNLCIYYQKLSVLPRHFPVFSASFQQKSYYSHDIKEIYPHVQIVPRKLLVVNYMEITIMLQFLNKLLIKGIPRMLRSFIRLATSGICFRKWYYFAVVLPSAEVRSLRLQFKCIAPQF